MGNDPLLIVGTGAMACLFALHLSAASVPVTMLGSWPEGVSALRERGVCLVNSDGSEKTYFVEVISGHQAGDHYGLAVVLVKSWQTGRAARQLAGWLAPDGVALTLQNGLGNLDILAHTLGEDRVAQGVVTMGAFLSGPGRVIFGGEGEITLQTGARMDDFHSMFSKAGFPVKTTEDLTALIWRKLVINSAINPLTAILQVPNGELLSRPSLTLLSLVARESAAVASELGINLGQADPVQMVEQVARNTAQNLSSMLQDVQRGAQTEIDAINGAITRLGVETGIPTPINHALWLLVKAIVDRKKGQ